MTVNPDKPNAKARPAKGGNTREDRLKAALKANLSRRKAQARKRSDGDQKTNEAEG
ncbi:hypothetical protein [Rhodophyticola sp. SM2404]